VTPDNDVVSIQRIDAVERILEVICRTTGLGFSAVARVTDTQWVACAVRDEIAFGLKPGAELRLETTICNEIRRSGERVVIDHVADDPLFRDHPTPKMYGFQSYISVPIRRSDGSFFGTLCAIDPNPHKVAVPQVIAMFELFAELIATQLDAHDRLVESEAALLDARETSKLREQFIAVLGHDLRNPLSAIRTGSDVLRALVTNEKAMRMLDLMDRSIGRMDELIGNVLDFASGRLGGGLSMERTATADLAIALEQIVAELRVASPGRVIRSDIHIPIAIVCDRARLGQMLSNLLANALAHGDLGGDIVVLARVVDRKLELSVENRGEIPLDVREHLFQPFTRHAVRPTTRGLGLGLYIASEIARAHGGDIDARSKDGVTRFTARIPLTTG
jgi:signal transduction histidine kinase